MGPFPTIVFVAGMTAVVVPLIYLMVIKPLWPEDDRAVARVRARFAGISVAAGLVASSAALVLSASPQ